MASIVLVAFDQFERHALPGIHNNLGGDVRQKRRSALVTGAAGFIGSRVSSALLDRGWRVVAYDDLSLSQSWWRLENAAGVLKRVEGDLLDTMALERAARGVDVVFHHAGLSTGWPQNATPREWHAINVTGVLQLLEIVRFAGASRVILSDTCANDPPDLSEADGLHGNRFGFDAITRAAAQRYARHFAEHTDLDTVTLCYAEVFGPYQLHVHPAVTPIASLVRDLLDDNVPLLLGDERRSRDFVFIDDVVEANLLAADASEALRGQRIPIASGVQTTMSDAIRTARRLLGKSADPRFRRSSRRPPFASRPHVRSARERLGFVARTPFDEGLHKTIMWQQLAWG